MRRPRQRRQRKAPWLASDLVRSFLSAIGMIAVIPVMPALIDAATIPVAPLPVLATTAFALWIAYGVVYALVTALVFAPIDAERFADVIAETTPQPGWRTVVWVANGGGAVSWALTGSVTAIVAVVLLVSERTLLNEPVIVGLAIGVVVVSWALTMLAYAVRYAREWVRSGGVEFGGDEQPRFADFVYLAVQVATTFASSDVRVTTRRMRKVVALNSIVAFAYNTVIVALLVSTLISAAG